MPTRHLASRPFFGAEDESGRPSAADDPLQAAREKPQTTLSERVDPAGYMSSSTWSIGSRHSQDTGEYEMSVVNDSGVYLPLSPTDDDASRPHGLRSRASTDTRGGSPSEHEPFFLSRGSLDSFRRSFDIRATSPILGPRPGSTPNTTTSTAVSKEKSRSAQRAASRCHDGWSQARTEWSPWGRDRQERAADLHGPVAIAFRGVGGAVLRR